MHLDLTLPLLAFGGPYSNLRALDALRRRTLCILVRAPAADAAE